ncbi:DNA-binding transcriptional regulator, MarR family [Poseidonocella pacifica]|uniref:DNA-binding transcriptional regulator, MarR family n=1 Tax=Poseidonocella pacifica TaxID=871651 RepID=A0A1I0WRN4_9RHOB|nr:MarR family transcriptional regulator [Poseidonocella pacifica]SFA90848.1 DNA-binding transcriptional regulator, MarR family [Poseidonocella pacifica]
MDRTDDSLIALRRILRATERYGRDLAQAAGLTAAQFRVLQLVSESRPCTATDISRRMKISQATVTSLVDKLVAQGMVLRQRSERDRRQTHIEVTEKGARTARDAPDALQQRFVRTFEGLEDWEQSMLVSALERVAAMLDPSDVDAVPVLDTADFRKTT